MDRVKYFGGRLPAGLVTGLLVLAQPSTGLAGDLENRVNKLERMMQSQGLVEMHSRLDQLQAEVRNLRGEVELQTYNVEQLQNRQRQLYLDIDGRLRQLETGGGSPTTSAPPPPTSMAPAVAPPPPTSMAPAVAPPPPTSMAPAVAPPTPTSRAMPPAVAPPPAMAPALAPPPSTPPPSRPAADPAKEREAYEKALNILREGRYQEAADAYRRFLNDYPNSSYADNAQYWLAESYYVTRKFDTALEQFQQVIDAHPASTKTPDARLKIGYILYEKSDWPGARRELETVAREFPDTTAARLAQDRLDRMRKEGH